MDYVNQLFSCTYFNFVTQSQPGLIAELVKIYTFHHQSIIEGLL